MDEFINKLDSDKFRATNAAWNKLRLNDPWSVGYVSALIELKSFSCKEDWEEFYYSSGAYRDQQISALDDKMQILLNNESLILTNPQIIKTLDSHVKSLNYNLGRTKEQLAKKGKLLFEVISGNEIKISIEACIKAVRFRTICETWNGIILRERNTVANLRYVFPQCDFIKKDGAFDHSYAVDYEVYFKNRLCCALQIKPQSYLGSSPYLLKAQAANSKKNKKYTDQYGAPVFDVISKTNGEIIHKEILQKIAKTLG